VSATAISRLEQEMGRLAGATVRLERPSRAEHGDYATNVAMQQGPRDGRPPRELAESLAAEVAKLPLVERAEVAGPGFLNVFLTPEWYGAALAEILDAGAQYGGGSAAAVKERAQVELVSANPTGPLTVGSARNAAYGDSVARLLAFAGDEVEREYYFNDVGRQIDLFRESVEARRRGAEPRAEGYTGDYVREIAAEPGDPVERMLKLIEDELEEFRVHVDSWVLQREVELEIPDVLPELDRYDAEGTTWARTSAYGDDKDRPLARSSDGSFLYYAGDVAYVRNKFERGFDRLIYVLGADHHGYIGRLKAAAAMLGYDPDRLEVLIYQLVHIVEEGEARQSSKRRGDVVFLRELVEKIGIDAARWYLVSRGHDQAIDIDVDLAKERSEKNPVYYVQYAHARIAGILRNADGAAANAEAPADLAPEERELVKRLAEFPEVVSEATQRRAAHAIPNYAIRVADDFHRFYHRHRVLGSDRQGFRLALVLATKTVLGRSLDLIGVEAPERM
jgi:arginyl-tRNA synthetase